MCRVEGEVLLPATCNYSTPIGRGNEQKYPFLISVYHFWPSAHFGPFRFGPFVAAEWAEWWLHLSYCFAARHLWEGPGCVLLEGLMNYYAQKRTPFYNFWFGVSFVAKIIKWPGMNDLMTMPRHNCRSAEKGSIPKKRRGWATLKHWPT